MSPSSFGSKRSGWPVSQIVLAETNPSGEQRRALVIAHEVDGPGGQVTKALEDRGFIVDTHVVVPDADQPNVANPFPDWSDYDLIAPMGSVRSMTNKDEISNWIHEEMDLVRAAADRGQPVLGVCFGGQLIAEALGGSVEESPVTELGWFDIQPAEGKENPVGPGPWKEWHHDRFVAPPGSEVLAVSEVGPQLFTIGRMAGTQFHPEVDVAHIEGWLTMADDEYLTSHGRDRESILAEMRAQEAQSIEGCRHLVDWFLDDIAFPQTPGSGPSLSSLPAPD